MDWTLLTQNLNWFVKLRNPKDVFTDNPTLLAVEIMFYICFLLTLKHAIRNGGWYIYLWMTILINGFTIEYLSSVIPNVDNFWHAQSMVMFLGRKIPLFIICLYPVLNYTSSVAVSRLKLPLWSAMCAVGVTSTIMDLPQDILGIKLLWWSFHDTDPNVEERIYWAPWLGFFFFAASMSTLTLLHHSLRRLIVGSDANQKCCCCREIICSLLTAFLSIPLTIVQFTVLYHIPHDIFKVPSGICFAMLFSILALLAWTGDRCSNVKRTKKGKFDELWLVIIIYYLFYGCLVFLAQPQNVVSEGYHQPIGNCEETFPVPVSTGMVLSRKKYLCPTNYNEGYFDFRCAIQPLEKWKNQKWYIICGTPFDNRYEYIAVIVSTCLFGLYYFYQLLINSGSDVYSSTSTQKVKTK